MLLDVGEVSQASKLMPTEKFRTTRFYKEWAGPAGYGDTTVAVIEKSASVVTFLFAPHRDCDSPAGSQARRRMKLLVPHVRRAVAIGNVIAMHKVDASVLSDAVDALSAGVFLVADDGRMIRANESGRAMLASGDMLVLDGGILAGRGSAAARQAMRNAIAEAVGGGVIVNPRGVAIPLVSRNGEHYVAHILPLTSGARRKAVLGSPAAVAAIFVHNAAAGGMLPLEAIAQQFQLSPAELRVLVAVVEVGGNVSEIASVLGISEPTVKTHLRRLFEKTGARRQAGSSGSSPAIPIRSLGPTIRRPAARPKNHPAG
jgi:DNA-binding CsgD family transcriptional regulator